MEIGLVKRIDIDSEMQQAYLDYAMSVIVARALPDARDGLKPVHRRILYAMYDMGLRPDTAYKKSARIVGEVLGKYHPHGDAAVYDAMSRMAQDFSMRYVLVDGQGNFGSVDGDPPAAMRYTEARLAALAGQILADIQKNTVDFSPNFDDTLQEPVVLPAALPNLLVNGATGIAVGMATSIPPHNLGEVVEALTFMLENWNKLEDISVDDLMKFIQGPDFPTGGVILEESGGEGLHSAYGSGRGRVTVRARAHLEEMERGRNRIIVTELPYMTNKAGLIERIAELVREERLEGIADLRDESDRQGMRIVIELNKTADPEAVLRNLYKHTPMQGTFSIIMLALVDGEPRLLSLKQALRVYLEHRLEIVKRRSQYDLEKARARAHILEGLRIALKNLDEVIDLIRKAPDADTARQRLIKRFKLSEIQAQAILDMQLRRLAALERKKIEEEYKQVQAQIKELESLLRSPARMRAVVSEELLVVRDTYGDRRRTQIVHLKEGEEKRSLLTTHDLTPEKTVWIVLTADGKIARTPEDALKLDPGGSLSGEAGLLFAARASTRDTLYLSCEQGDTAALSVATIPEAAHSNGSASGVGVPLAQVSALKEVQRLVAMFALPPKPERAEDEFILTVTRQGMVKKSAASELPGPSAGTFPLVKINAGDRLGWVRKTGGQAEVFLATVGGMAIRFTEEEVRPMGLVAAGVMGIRLQEGDELAGAEVLPAGGKLPKDTALFMIATDGTGKRLAGDEFPKQGRYGQGVSAWKLPKGRVAGVVLGAKTDQAILQLEKTTQVVRLEAAPLTTRQTRGQRVVDVKAGGEVRRVVLVCAAQEPGSPAAGKPESASAVGEKKGRKAAPVQLAFQQDGEVTDGKPAGRARAAAQAASRQSANAQGKAAGKTTAAAGKKAEAAKSAGKTRAAKSSPAAQPDGAAGKKVAPPKKAAKAAAPKPEPKTPAPKSAPKTAASKAVQNPPAPKSTPKTAASRAVQNPPAPKGAVKKAAGRVQKPTPGKAGAGKPGAGAKSLPAESRTAAKPRKAGQGAPAEPAAKAQIPEGRAAAGQTPKGRSKKPAPPAPPTSPAAAAGAAPPGGAATGRVTRTRKGAPASADQASPASKKTTSEKKASERAASQQAASKEAASQQAAGSAAAAPEKPAAGTRPKPTAKANKQPAKGAGKKSD